MRLKKLGITLLVITLLSASPVRAAPGTVGDVSGQLVCQCGCTLVLSNCSHVGCVREAMVALIEQKLAEGESQEEILDYFVAQYGEQVLASPPKRGFNLMAWVLPFAAILSGGGVIYVALKKWVKRGTYTPSYAAIETDESDEKYQRQLEEELHEFTERSFR